MCGITGVVTPGAVPARETIERMLTALAHRGPDGSYMWTEGCVALGMRRLAIVDVAGGAQPLRNEDGAIQVLFNGEIYNHRRLRAGLEARGHRLESATDGAVIPHLYEELGARLFTELAGIFAIAIWDRREQALLLARDQLGVKPLYVHRARGGIRFASEIKALFDDPSVSRELDLAALDQYLTFRFTPAPRTLLAGIDKVEPGTVWRWRSGELTRTRYWRSAPPPRSALSFRSAAERFLREFDLAVERQMMSDRPIGVMLSGGLDSAAVTACMARRSANVNTFTIGFEGGGDADETTLAGATARLFGTNHHELIVSDSEFLAEFPRVIAMLEEPVGTSSAMGFGAVSRLAKPHVPVLLSGQGADELLAGYWRYVGEWIAATALALPRPLSLVLPTLAAGSSRVRSARLERGLRALRSRQILDRFMDIYAVLTPKQKQWLYGPEMLAASADRPSAPVERLLTEAVDRDPLDKMMYVDLRLWLPDDLLLVGDKMSMAESVEMRVPFLDTALVDFVESLPSNYKIRRARRKAVAKSAFESILPRQIVHRKERGFATPIDRWLRSTMAIYAREVMLGSDALCPRLFKRGPLEKLLARHAQGEFDHTRQLFCLLTFELWGRMFLDKVPPPDLQPLTTSASSRSYRRTTVSTP
jgi:asparagine synthase (glutamine-hydrolysing)